MGPGSRATVDRLDTRWSRLEQWAAGATRPGPTSPELVGWLSRVRERARAQGWRPQWETWVEWRDRALRNEIGEDDLPGELYGRAQDLGVAERRAEEAGYALARGLEPAETIARHPDASPQADAYRAPGKVISDAAQVLEVAVTPPQIKGSGWWTAAKVGAALGFVGLAAIGARAVVRAADALR